MHTDGILSRFAIRCSLFIALGLAGCGPALAAGYICAEGGGSVRGGDWARGVFGWMLEHGRCGHVLVLRTADSESTVTDVFVEFGAASARGLTVTPETANSLATYETIIASDILWLPGGDQSRYVGYWNGTLTEQAIRDVYARGGVVGGTSAGCAVLGDVVYDAAVGSLRPEQALRDPYHPNLTLTSDFLNLTPGVVFDTHFTERGRLPRLAVMMARCHEDLGKDVLGIGVDHRTALCVYPDLSAEVRGEGSVTLLHRTAQTVQALEAGRPPVVTAIAYAQLTEGYRYDLVRRCVIAWPTYAERLPPASGLPEFQAARLDGDDIADAMLGEVYVSDGDDQNALTSGTLKCAEGSSLLRGAVVSTRTWADADFVENRVGGVQYALARRPHLLGIYLDAGARVRTAPPATLIADPASDAAVVILDGLKLTGRAFSTYCSSPGNAATRQSVALESATLHLLAGGWAFEATHRSPTRCCVTSTAPVGAKVHSQGREPLRKPRHLFRP